MTTDIFRFWASVGPSEKVHPADREVFKRVGRTGHGLDLRCLPGPFAGPLRTAPVVLLFLSPGFSPRDLKDAEDREAQNYYARKRAGREPLSADGAGYDWLMSRVKLFDVDFEQIRNKLALLEIGAYHSKNFTDYPLLAALPSSRVALEWAQGVLFPQAIRGERVVVCLRSAHFWGLECGKRHGRALFAPEVTRGGHIMKKTKKQIKFRNEIVYAVKEALAQ